MATYLDLAGNLARTHLQRATGEYQSTLRRLSAGEGAELGTGRVSDINLAQRAGHRTDVLDVAVRNIDSAVNLLEIASEGLSRVEELLGRGRALALQATSSNLGDVERSILDVEYQSILQEIDRLAQDTTFNGQRALVTGIRPVIVDDAFDVPESTEATFSFAEGTGAGGDPGPVGLVNGELQLTPAIQRDAGAAVSRIEFPTFSGVSAEFRYFMGDSNTVAAPGSGDGLAFFFVDGDAFDNDRSPAGGFGGGLGYRNIDGGFFGVGFDVFGNFSLDPGRIRNQITVRGPTSPSGDPPEPNRLLARTGGTAADQNAPAVFGGNALDGGYRDVRINLDDALNLRVEISFDGGNNFITAHEINLGDEGIPVPRVVKFGFSASTGGADNAHRIDRVTVQAALSVRERIRLSASQEGQAIVQEFGSAASQVSATAFNNRGHDFLPVGLFDATTQGLTINGTRIGSQVAARVALGRIDFARDQISQGRVILGAQAERFKLAREEAVEAIEGDSVLRSLFVDADVPDESRLAALHSALVEVGLYTAAEIEDLKRSENEGLLDILA